jgi:zona occludens toxin (predicted ATPase)
MDEREPIRVVRDEKVQGKRSPASAWLATGIVILVIALGLTIGYIFQQQNNAKALMTRDNGMSATIDQMQNEIDSLTSKLNQAPPAAATPSATPVQPGAAHAASRRQTATTNKRFKEMQAKLDDQQKQLKDTQDQVAQTRSDFEAGLT